jgi:hypothetical protein
MKTDLTLMLSPWCHSHLAWLVGLVLGVVLASLGYADAAGCGAENRSSPTTCAEEDNINVPLYAGRASLFWVVATHPTYEVGADNCAEDFSGCPSSNEIKVAQIDACLSNPVNKLYDDHTANAIWVCTELGW